MSALRGPQSSPALEQTWRERVTRFQTSGLSVRDFCRGEGLSEPSFYSWRRTITERDAARAAPNTPAFIPLHVRPDPASPALELVLRSGYVLRIPPGCDPEHLRAVVAALEAAPC